MLNKSLFKKISSFFFLILFALTLSVSAETVKVAILKSGEFAQYETAINGFVDEFDYIGKTINSTVHLLSAKDQSNPKIISDILKSNPQIILAVGSEAAKFCTLKIKDKPIVFCMLLDPASQGLVGVRNMTGVSLDIPHKNSLQELLKIVPSAKNVGLLYNPEVNGDNVSNAKVAAGLLGLTLISEKVYSRGDITKGFLTMVDEIDAMWIITDPVVSNAYSIKYLLLNTLQNEIPVIGISKNYVKAGALFALTTDFYDIGRQAAELASQIIIQGISPKNIPIAKPRKYNLILNKKTANAINLRIPTSVIKKAKEVFK